ncbi:hypothetical protein DEO72_LG10g2365 [Vigna unguiculata]|uniref:Uncharacterized protein n=1 Tax=Vigna unguiculata TaxID=3917 RepID=A0A4D6NE23_VIGUN|nr:hypothetical protein DEO72_LG10g2365 [Vigna unguiculata]
MEYTLDHPLTTTPWVFLDQTQSKTPKITQNRAQQTRVTWRKFITARQFIRETQKLGCSFTSLSGTGTHCQAVPQRNPRTPNWHVPPGDYEQPARRFLEKS